MLRIAVQMLVGDKLKYWGLVGAIAFASMLISQQASIMIGLIKQTGSFIRDTSQADIWVMDSQVRFSQDSLPLRASSLRQVQGIDGVEWATPLFYNFAQGQLSDGTRFSMLLVGIDDTTLIGAPPVMVEGRLEDLRRDRAVFIDAHSASSKIVAQSTGRPVQVGDRIFINDVEARVEGSFNVRDSFFWDPVLYTTYSRALSFVPARRNLMSYILVKLKPGASVSAVQKAIEQKTGLIAPTQEQFIERTARYIVGETGIIINFGLAVALGFLIGAIVAGQTLYNFTNDNLRVYGSLKAMGVSHALLGKMVLLQASIVGVLGYGIGLGIASLMGIVVARAGLAFSMPWQIPVLTGVAVIVIALAASLISLRRVFRLEPAVVFRS